MREYDRFLDIIEKRVIGHAMVTGEDELRRTGERLFGTNFKGVYAANETKVPRTLRNGESCILNLDKRNQAGSHWVGVLKHNNELITYDSFGRRVSNTRHTDDDAEQRVIEVNCGQRCLAWLCVYYNFGIECALRI